VSGTDNGPSAGSTRADPPRRRLPGHLGDFTVTPRVLVICAWALPVGAAGAGASWVLLRLIGLITNLVFFGRFSGETVSPGAGPHPWWLVLGAPIAGGLVVGVMARYGSEKIRGHGMPEAIEAILTRGSRVEPKVAVLKPVSAAVSIGTGGPFGAEGPIIMTGGALGSILAQYLHLSADERKALMVGGAAAGMAATFNAPLASVLLAVELLLFEWRPRSYLPVVAAVAVATLLRAPLLGSGPIFPVDVSGWHVSPVAEVLCVLAGGLGGLLAVVVTSLVYFSEDRFARLGSFRVGARRLGLHWMWWPAIGGLIIGLGGLVEPRALGVGYDVIDEQWTGQATLALIVGILVVKSLIWGLSLGSGTSGGVLAPVFMIGAALGALEAHVLPAAGAGFWALIGLAAVVGGVMRSPLTGVVFSLELTHAWPALLALLIASSSAYGVSTLLLRRSVLTEKIARRGYHLSREYDVDPLEVLFVDEVMHPTPTVLHPEDPLPVSSQAFAATVPRPGREAHGAVVGPGPAASPADDEVRQRLFPVVADDGLLLGVVGRHQLDEIRASAVGEAPRVADVMIRGGITVNSDDTLARVRECFAGAGITAAPVVAPTHLASTATAGIAHTVVTAGGAEQRTPGTTADAGLQQAPELLGLITVEHLLDGRLPDLAEEHHRSRIRTPTGRHTDGPPTPPEEATSTTGRSAPAGPRVTGTGPGSPSRQKS
jgi:CIC family chloride channel protein